MIKVGQRVSFYAFEEMKGFASELNRGKKTKGTVIYVNENHR